MAQPFRAWFPTFIYSAPLERAPGSRLRRDLLDDSHKLRAQDRAGQRWSRTNYRGGYTSYGSNTQLHRTFSTFMELAKKIDRHVRTFARRLDMDLMGRRLQMADCWVNVMPRQTVHALHLHPLSVVSGTYYLMAPRGCARLRFEDPRLDRFMGAPPKSAPCRPENRQQVAYDVAAGQVILFESWLRHEVAANPSALERVSVSFNYHWV
jgi:uncharacterized protein (TIGR02466 family)